VGRLDGTVAYVTGGASGLGRAVVRRFVAEGARVGVLDLSNVGNAALEAEFGEAVMASTGDVREYVDHERAVLAIEERFGPIDVYVGNAAIWDGNLSLDDLPSDVLGEAFDEVFGVNVKGYLLGAKAVRASLVARHGAMVFTLSTASLHASAGGPLYTASKHAALGLVRQLAYELAPDVRVNGVAPAAMITDLRGPTALDMNRPLMVAVDRAQMRDGYPLDFVPDPDDYAATYVYLASSTESRTVTGTVVEADLGARARGIHHHTPHG
jgi:2,3-dihydroxy-2,3-dihydrophenylpropionate dehydrogenase